MIPVSFISDVEFEEYIEPDKTYKLDHIDGTVNGYIDEKESIKQAIYKIINTERYVYPIYSWDYGIELSDLYGEDVNYVCAELEDRIIEALTQDERITEVKEFEFNTGIKGVIGIKFTAVTNLGDIDIEREVDY